MKLYSEDKNYKIYQGSMLDMLEVIDKNSLDSIICDPPYELNFMNKGWDNSGIAFQKQTWQKCFEVLKPGGYLLAFGGTRTFHRIACAIEDAGFEIRDTIMWLYGSGFPKSLNIGLAIDKKNGIDNRTGNIVKGVDSNNTNSMKNGLGESQEFAPKYEERKATNEWAGWGTCLKPAYEPIIVARKPCEGSTIDNVLKYGVGGINIDECRIKLQDNETIATNIGFTENKQSDGWGTNRCVTAQTNQGRFPANLILTYDENDKEEVCGGFPNTKSTGGKGEASKINTFANTYNGGWGKEKNCAHLGGLGDEGSAARYFYCAKASKKDRDEGLMSFEEKQKPEYCLQYNNGEKRNENSTRRNIHPTVKPVELMQYLVRLVTPTGGDCIGLFLG